MSTMRRMLGAMRLPFGESWVRSEADQGFTRRRYASYEQYLARQKAKLKRLDLSRYDLNYRAALRVRLGEPGLVQRGMSVLCLGARIGTEVKAFLDRGCFAVGVDLNPGEGNRFVVHGDFHQLQYANRSIDLVFTNSLDHVFAVDRLVAEIERVLKPAGLLILEVGEGGSGGKKPGHYESFWWSTVDDVVSLFEGRGFRLVYRQPFVAPWAGEQLCFRAAARESHSENPSAPA
jgi:SAM-dependent methyltransferase